MNIAKLAVRPWLRTYEAAHYLTSKLDCGPYGSENGISEPDVLDFALAGYFLLTLDIPPSTTDKRGVELEDGYWDLLMNGPRGKPGRRQVKLQVGPPVSVKGIDGAWVARKIAGNESCVNYDHRRIQEPFPRRSLRGAPWGCEPRP